MAATSAITFNHWSGPEGRRRLIHLEAWRVTKVVWAFGECFFMFSFYLFISVHEDLNAAQTTTSSVVWVFGECFSLCPNVIYLFILFISVNDEYPPWHVTKVAQTTTSSAFNFRWAFFLMSRCFIYLFCLFISVEGFIYKVFAHSLLRIWSLKGYISRWWMLNCWCHETQRHVPGQDIAEGYQRVRRGFWDRIWWRKWGTD